MTVEECPQCGAPADPSTTKCRHCKSPFVINTVSALSDFDESAISKYVSFYKKEAEKNPADDKAIMGLGICYLRLGLFDLAKTKLQKCIELVPDDGDAYYYYAVSLTGGRLLKSIPLGVIKEIEKFVETASQLNKTEAKYYLFWAMIKHGYYKTNGMSVGSPADDDLLRLLQQGRLDMTERRFLFEILRFNHEGFIF